MNKEQYLSIVSSWKKYINEGKHKKYKNYYSGRVLKTGSSWNYDIVDNVGYYWKSDLTAMHYYVYGLIRKKDLTKAMNEKTIADIHDTLNFYVRYSDKEKTYAHDMVTKLLIPFGQYFTVDILKELLK